MSRIKETNFFLAEEENWRRGVGWYAAQFERAGAICGEASPRYTAYPLYQGVPARICSLLPQARLVYFMRDPLARTLSHYTLWAAQGREHRTFEEAVADPDRSRFVACSCYHRQLEQFLERFPLPTIFLATLEELRADPRRIMAELFGFLGADPGFYSHAFTAKVNSTVSHRPKARLGRLLQRLNNLRLVERLPLALRVSVGRFIYLPFSKPLPRAECGEATHQRLLSIFREDVSRLRNLTGRVFPDWSV